MKIGVHNVGSFGTTNQYQSSYYTGGLSFLVDSNHDGFNASSTQAFAGDYTTPGAPIEGQFIFSVFSLKIIHFFLIGWIIQYKKASTTYSIYNMGLSGYTQLLPKKFSITSNGNKLSLIWISRNNDIEVRKIYQMNYNNAYVKCSVSIKNIGTSSLSNFYCKFEIVFLCSLHSHHILFLPLFR
jgi:hypothetical protein